LKRARETAVSMGPVTMKGGRGVTLYHLAGEKTAGLTKNDTTWYAKGVRRSLANKARTMPGKL